MQGRICGSGQAGRTEHTAGHVAYLFGDRTFTGDALLIEGCGGTDFQEGDADALYKSVHEKLFSLPDDTLVYPAHDYKGRRVSSVTQRKNVTRDSARGAR